MAKTNVRGGQIADGAQGVDLTVDVTGVLPTANGGVAAGGSAGQFYRQDKTWQTLLLSDLPDAWTKRSCRVASTANMAVASAVINGASVDGVTVATGDRILLKNQTAPAENGIYIVAASGAASRATDADTASEIAGGVVNVDTGTANGGQTFKTTFKSTDTLGTTAMNWYALVDLSSVQTLANKILTAPNVDQLDDTNGVKALEITATASAVNYARVVNNIAGQPPSIGVGGSDANISMNLFGKGTGIILLNGLAAVDVSTAQTLTNKTLTDPTINHAMRGYSHVTSGTFTTSGTTELTLATVTITCDGVTPVEVQFTWYNFVKSVAGDTFLWKLYDGATQIAQALNENTAVVNTAAKPLRTVLTPTAGSHSFTAKIVRNTGTGTAQGVPTTSAPFDLTVTPWF